MTATRMALAQLPEAASSVTMRGVARGVVKTHHAEFRHMPMEMQGMFHAEAVAGKRRTCADSEVAIASMN